MSYGYIYKTTNLTNGRLYIGQKKGIFNHNYLGSGKYFKSALSKYGKNKFKLEVIVYVDNKEQLNLFEKHLISKYRDILGKDNLYNIGDGGEGTNGEYLPSRLGSKLTEEHKKRISETQKGKIVSEETKQKMRGTNNHFYGKHHSQETKLKMLQKSKGYKFTPEQIENNRLSKLGHVVTEETREKIRQSHLGDKSYMFGKPAWNKGKKLGFVPKCAFKKGNVPWNKKVK